METFKKIAKVVAVIVAVAAAIAGIYIAVTKLMEKKKTSSSVYGKVVTHSLTMTKDLIL